MTARQIKAQYFAVLGVFMLAGLIVTAYGTYWLLLTKRFLANAQFTSGIVIDLKQSMGRRGSLFRPVFRFKDINGTERVVDELTASEPSPFCVGQTVPVAYPAGDPMKARVNTFGTLWFFPVVISALGVLFILIPGIGFALVVIDTNLGLRERGGGGRPDNFPRCQAMVDDGGMVGRRTVQTR